jgi:hypothetical protein
MWRLCKELKGTESLNERDPFPCGEIISLNLRHIPLGHGCVETRAPQWSRFTTGTAISLFRIGKRCCSGRIEGVFITRLRSDGRRDTFQPRPRSFISCTVLVNCCVRRLEHSSVHAMNRAMDGNRRKESDLSTQSQPVAPFSVSGRTCSVRKSYRNVEIYCAGYDPSRPFRVDLPFCRELGNVPPATQRLD